ncbi:MAG: hypothetical protein JSS93_12720 [Bacteroidetes bacterium]|nr:hypothetical protein [Bacteroidota bacterium]
MKFSALLSLVILLFITEKGYSSPPDKIGVLVLAHGGSEAWNQLIVGTTESIGKKYPVEVAFGMALPRTLQEGIDKLENKGVNKIVVVPLFISSHSFIIRQTEYLLKKRNVLADSPVVMDHSPGVENNTHGSMDTHHSNNMSHGSGHESHESSHTTLPQLNFKSEVILTQALDDSPIVAEILYARIKELSVNPNNETVIIVGHGPNPEEDNKNWVKTMESLAAQVQQKQKKEGIASRFIFSVTVRDDANREVYEQAKENLRALVRQASKQGDVIVVPLLLSKGGIEQGIIKRLDGLTYKWSGKMLLPDPKVEQFIENSVKEAIRK